MPKLRWAFNSATVMDLPWPEELGFWQRFKWSAAELWYDKIKARLDAGETCAALARQLRDAGVRPIGVSAAVVWTESERHDAADERSELARRLDVTAAVGAPALTVVVLGKVGPDLAQEYCRLADKLRAAGDMAAAHKVKLNVEFLGGLPIVGTLRSCIELLNAANHPAVGMLFDLCHYYVSASHLEELPLLPADKLFLIHVDDARKKPLETLKNDERCFPGEGLIDVPGLLSQIRKLTNYDGYFSLEIYDKEVWRLPAQEVFQRAEKSIQFVEERLKV
ncbi:MAG: sugar phosphate isomerase/epimerase [Planctomycetota bacterium]|nr:sugar phosphate isomerase/epimerase [Planctomycetota bacterium]